MSVPDDEFKKYLAGFFDGDGSVTLEKQNGGFCLRIKFSQSNKDMLEHIQSYYPFLRLGGGPRREGCKPEYELRAGGKQISPLLDDLISRTIIKQKQLLLAKEYLNLIRVQNANAKKHEMYEAMKKLKNEVTIERSYERINKYYIAGLFDAEGSIGLYGKTMRLKITQKSDHELLRRINIFYNNTTSINNHACCFYCNSCIPVIQDIIDTCVYKKPQLEIALSFLQNNDDKELVSLALKTLKQT